MEEGKEKSKSQKKPQGGISLPPRHISSEGDAIVSSPPLPISTSTLQYTPTPAVKSSARLKEKLALDAMQPSTASRPKVLRSPILHQLGPLMVEAPSAPLSAATISSIQRAAALSPYVASAPSEAQRESRLQEAIDLMQAEMQAQLSQQLQAQSESFKVYEAAKADEMQLQLAKQLSIQEQKNR